MQFQLTRQEYVRTIEFRSEAIQNVQRIRYFKEEGLTGTFTKKEFRYSWDNSTWTNWNTLTQANLSNIVFRDQPNFYLEVKYTRVGIGSGNILGFYIFYDSNTPAPPTPPIDASIDAWSFQQELPAYYLDRANHTGPFTALSVSNIAGDSSTFGVYYGRSDSSLGTILNFKRIGVTGVLGISEVGGTITIDASSLDVSTGYIYDKLLELDASVVFLTDWNISQDASIVILRADVSSLDYSVVQLTNSLIIVKSDVSTLTLWNQIQDASIISLESQIAPLEASIIRIDSSINSLFSITLGLESSINYNTRVNITQDASIIRIDTILQIHDVSIGDLYNWQNIQDASIEELRISISGTDASIQRIDSSLIDIYNVLSIIDASLIGINSHLNTLDASIVGLTAWNEVQDASIEDLRSQISTTDASIVDLSNWNLDQDASIVDLRIDIVQLDASIVDLTDWNEVQDVSIEGLRDRIDITDASVISLTDWNTSQDASIEVLRSDSSIANASINYLTDWNESQDASIIILRDRADTTDASIIEIQSDISSIEASIALIVDDQVINIGDGSIGIYASRDASNNILLKTIDQIGPVLITEDGSTILVDSSTVKIYNTTIDSSYQTYKDVGGIEIGTLVSDLKGDGYNDILNQMLFPLIDPTYLDPSLVSFTKNGNDLYEVDANPSLTFTAVFDQGSITINDIFQDYRSGLPQYYHYRGPGFNQDIDSSSLTDSQLEVIDLGIGISTWVCWVDYLIGPQPIDSHNGNYGTPLPASDTSTLHGTLSVSLEGVYPLFATSSSITTYTQQSLVSMLEGNDIEIALVPETGGNKQSFDLPDKWKGAPTNRPLVGIETRINETPPDWGYQGGIAMWSLFYWFASPVTHTIQGNVENYTRYTYTGDDRGDTVIRLKF